MRIWLPTFVLLAALPMAAGELRITVPGVESDAGAVRVALFASADDFANDRPVHGSSAAARVDGVHVVFPALSPGRYGITSFHDRDDDAEIDTNLMGVPTEPYGFSRNARGRFGPPSFDDLSFEVGDDDVRMEIELR